MLELDSSISQYGLMKTLKLIQKIASSVSDMLADSLLILLVENHGTLSNFLNCSNTVKDVRSFSMEGVSGHYLRKDFNTVNNTSKHGLIRTVYLSDPATSIKR